VLHSCSCQCRPSTGREEKHETQTDKMVAVVTLSLCGCAGIARSMQSPVERLDERGVSAPSLTVEAGTCSSSSNADTSSPPNLLE